MGRPPCCDKSNVKRGLWTAEEDAKILAYVSNYGTGNWASVPKKAGLKRCGKSCRLRYTNYLRPDIKREGFTPEEEELIITLHATIGSRWSTIAQQLPGRTDNDVKNYWNTKLKKKLAQKGIDPVTHKPIAHIYETLVGLPGLGCGFLQQGTGGNRAQQAMAARTSSSTQHGHRYSKTEPGGSSISCLNRDLRNAFVISRLAAAGSCDEHGRPLCGGSLGLDTTCGGGAAMTASTATAGADVGHQQLPLTSMMTNYPLLPSSTQDFATNAGIIDDVDDHPEYQLMAQWQAVQLVAAAHASYSDFLSTNTVMDAGCSYPPTAHVPSHVQPAACNPTCSPSSSSSSSSCSSSTCYLPPCKLEPSVSSTNLIHPLPSSATPTTQQMGTLPLQLSSPDQEICWSDFLIDDDVDTSALCYLDQPTDQLFQSAEAEEAAAAPTTASADGVDAMLTMPGDYCCSAAIDTGSAENTPCVPCHLSNGNTSSADSQLPGEGHVPPAASQGTGRSLVESFLNRDAEVSWQFPELLLEEDAFDLVQLLE